MSFGLPAFEADFTGGVGDSILGDSAKDLVMTADTVDDPARASRKVGASYLSRARKRGIEGRVMINVLVSKSGSVEKTRIVEADPQGFLKTPCWLSSTSGSSSRPAIKASPSRPGSRFLFSSSFSRP